MSALKGRQILDQVLDTTNSVPLTSAWVGSTTPEKIYDVDGITLMNHRGIILILRNELPVDENRTTGPYL
jgi:hypothetical protein